jgi:Cu2+-exporting ATPase
MTDAVTCYHCGARLPDGPAPATVEVDGRSRPVCSEGCRDTAVQIIDRGLTEFYRFREGPTGAAKARDREAQRWHSYDRPAMQREFVSTDRDGTRRAHLLLQGVRCAACTWLIENSLGRQPGVCSISVDPLTTRATLHWNPDEVALSELLAQLACLGYTPLPYTEDAGDRAAVEERRAALKRLIIAGLGMMQVMSFAVALYAGAWRDAEIEEFLRLISLVVATPVVFYAGSPFFRGAWQRLRAGGLGMDVPVAIAIGGAWAASVWNTFVGRGEVYFDSATMFVFFLSSARFLEMAGRHRALSLTGALARHLPRVATRVRNGRAEEVGAMELIGGDRVRVAPGGTVPADGRLISASGEFDESLLTGESTPVVHRQGDSIVAGSLNGRDAIEFEVTHVGADTVMAQIASLVGDAQAEKPQLVATADRVASYFVGAVLIAAAFTGIAWWSIAPERAFEVVLAVLVVTCPCALALATPAAFTVATSALARRGFMLRRAGALQVLAQVSDVIFDKTGTLTADEIGIDRVELLGALGEDQVLEIAAALEARSEHPLARAFRGVKASLPTQNVRAVPGSGLQGEIDGVEWRVGTRAFAADNAAGPLEDEGSARRIYLGNADGLVAAIELTETARAGVGDALAAMREAGLQLHVASGDRPGPVRALAARLGISQWRAAQQPADKLAFVRELQESGRRVAMLGDGINDSPVLAGADVSIAMGSGTSLAQHSADCVLMSSSLAPLAEAVRKARATMRVVRQNLAWAIVYNLVALPLAATGMLAPWMAALGMSASSLLVTLNALRLGRESTTAREPSNEAEAGQPATAAGSCCKAGASRA